MPLGGDKLGALDGREGRASWLHIIDLSNFSAAFFLEAHAEPGREGLIHFRYVAANGTRLKSGQSKYCPSVSIFLRLLEEHMATRTSTFDSDLVGARATNWRGATIAMLLALSIAGYFWVDSRYPALLKKYHAGAHVKAAGAISFDAVYTVDRGMPLNQRVLRTSANWLHANEIGMTFGFLFGAAALTLLGTFSVRRTRNAHVNAAIGALAGMPLGVCSNCVAPIGRGLYASGMSTESVLAAMFSSPTLNVVVLAMAFSLFSPAVVALKLATTLILILVFAPMIGARNTRYEPVVACPIDFAPSMTWGQAIISTLKSFAKSFWYVFRVGAPLLLLAAILGALIVEVVPQQGLTAPVTILGIILVAAVGTLLPVPMAFDVVIAYIAMTRGVPLPYVVALLCTLGIYSIYSFAIVGKTISWKVAGAASGAVFLLGTLAGFAAMGLH